MSDNPLKNVKGAENLLRFTGSKIANQQDQVQEVGGDFDPPEIPDIGDLKLPPKETRDVIEENFDDYKGVMGPKIAGNVERLIDALRVRPDTIFSQSARETIKTIDDWLENAMRTKPIYRKANMFAFVTAVNILLKAEYGKRLAEVEIPQRFVSLGFMEKEKTNKHSSERFQAGESNFVLTPEFFGEPRAKELVKGFATLLFRVRNPGSVVQSHDDLKRLAGDHPLDLVQLKSQEDGKMLLSVPRYHVAKNNTTCPGGYIVIEVDKGRTRLLGVLGGIRNTGWQIIDEEIWIPSNQLWPKSKMYHGVRVDFNLGFAAIFQQWIQESIATLEIAESKAELERERQARAETELEDLKIELQKRGKQSILDNAQFWLEKKGGFYLLEYSKFGAGEFHLEGRSYPDLYFLVHRKLKKKGSERQEFMDVVKNPPRFDEILLPYQTPIFTGSENFQNSVLGMILQVGYRWAKAKADAGELKVVETTPEPPEPEEAGSD